MTESPGGFKLLVLDHVKARGGCKGVVVFSHIRLIQNT